MSFIDLSIYRYLGLLEVMQKRKRAPAGLNLKKKMRITLSLSRIPYSTPNLKRASDALIIDIKHTGHTWGRSPVWTSAWRLQFIDFRWGNTNECRAIIISCSDLALYLVCIKECFVASFPSALHRSFSKNKNRFCIWTESNIALTLNFASLEPLKFSKNLVNRLKLISIWINAEKLKKVD